MVANLRVLARLRRAGVRRRVVWCADRCADRLSLRRRQGRRALRRHPLQGRHHGSPAAGQGRPHRGRVLAGASNASSRSARRRGYARSTRRLSCASTARHNASGRLRRPLYSLPTATSPIRATTGGPSAAASGAAGASVATTAAAAGRPVGTPCRPGDAGTIGLVVVAAGAAAASAREADCARAKALKVRRRTTGIRFSMPAGGAVTPPGSRDDVDDPHGVATRGTQWRKHCVDGREQRLPSTGRVWRGGAVPITIQVVCRS